MLLRLPWFLLLFCVIASFASAATDQLTPTVHTIIEKFLTDRQKLDPPFADTDTTSALENLSPNDAPFAPLKITLSPNVKIESLPKWATAPVIDKESSSIEIPIPALAEQTEIENFAITVNFYDMGDGGPLLEKQSKQEENPTLLCSGLGINGPALGLNSRTIAIPADVAIDGGKIIVRHVGRFEQLHSIILRPGRTAMVSVLDEKLMPAIISDAFNIIEQEEANGAIPAFKKGNIIHDSIISFELLAPIERLDGSLEFAFEMKGHPAASLFRTEIQGLDLEAHIDVELNGTIVGPLNLSSFQLNAPELIPEMNKDPKIPPFQFAGWRKGYVYLPQDLWKEKKSDQKESDDGKNHLLLIVRPGAHSSVSKIHLKNSCLEVPKYR